VFASSIREALPYTKACGVRSLMEFLHESVPSCLGEVQLIVAGRRPYLASQELPAILLACWQTTNPVGLRYGVPKIALRRGECGQPIVESALLFMALCGFRGTEGSLRFPPALRDVWPRDCRRSPHGCQASLHLGGCGRTKWSR
jgi:hypothetical protein